jgi:FdhD protein
MSPGILNIEYVEAGSDDWTTVDGCVIEELPLTLFINGQEWVTLMCTPVDQEELVLGFLLGEGVVKDLDDVALLEICQRGTVADVWLEHSQVKLPQRRVVTSGCVGGTTFADKSVVTPNLHSTRTVEPAQLLNLMAQLNQAATLYRQSRGVHTSALSDGEELLVVCEDVGRHNTLDKIRGACLRQGIDPRDQLLLTTGRISSEMLRKAADMGVPIVVSRTSATSLSLELAREWNITMVGYAQKRRLRIYADPAQRVLLPQNSINILTVPLPNRYQPVVCGSPG